MSLNVCKNKIFLANGDGSPSLSQVKTVTRKSGANWLNCLLYLYKRSIFHRPAVNCISAQNILEKNKVFL
ncbi:hypothetical protein Bcell_3859 [Evansella cellulosilytica DSM 2522]|uniref:Uncharacterized protein n=1 Tax=Evansella cellulosilytica (strain ATCC 21833 / DSM 2522 / FERM P-1141 / JCM 9156 / N-4) TaxID=649639 RepID=E6TUU6_EVAC2|nr:hypothetical protein Bcell_3859 [Evansella cellulosilytica DSM 2522]